MIPWFERPIIYDVRLRPQQISSATGTRDLQTVNITLRVLSRPSPHKLPEVYRQLGMNYEQRVLPSIITETLKSVVAQYNASELLTMREAVAAATSKGGGKGKPPTGKGKGTGTGSGSSTPRSTSS